MKFLIGQRVIISRQGGVEEMGTVEELQPNDSFDVRVFSPTDGYSKCYAEENVKPLPNGQL